MIAKLPARKFAAICSSVMILAIAPAASSGETLSDTLVAAYKHSGLLEQNRALLRAADEGVAQAVSALRPIISWSADLSRQFGNGKNAFGIATASSSTTANIGLSAEILLYDFGATPLRAEIARESVLATRQTLLAVEQNVLQRAVAAYMNVRRSSEFVALRNNNVRLISQELRAARDRFEVGEVTRTDVALAEARLAAARSGLAAAQGDLMRAQEEYRAAVGHKPRSLSAPPRVPNAAKSVDAAKAIARRNHPEMAKVQHDVKAAELSVLLAEAAMKPSIRLTGQYGLSEGLNSSFNNSGGSIGIRAAGPIYQGGRLSSLLRQSMAQRDVARASLHVVRMGVDQSVGNAFAQLSVARASLAATEQQVRASRVAFRGLREEASLGARTTLDVLNAEQELLNAQATQISAMADEQIAAYTLLASMGMLTAEQLRLRVQIYDPEAYYKQVKDAPTLRSKQGQKLDRVLRAIGKE